MAPVAGFLRVSYSCDVVCVAVPVVQELHPSMDNQRKVSTDVMRVIETRLKAPWVTAQCDMQWYVGQKA